MNKKFPIVPTKPSKASLCFGRLSFLRCLPFPLCLACLSPLPRPVLALAPSFFASCPVPCSSVSSVSCSSVSSVRRDISRRGPLFSPLPSLSQFSATFPPSFSALRGKNSNFASAIFSPVHESLLLSPGLSMAPQTHQPAKHTKAYARTKKYRAPPQKGFHTH